MQRGLGVLQLANKLIRQSPIYDLFCIYVLANSPESIPPGVPTKQHTLLLGALTLIRPHGSGECSRRFELSSRSPKRVPSKQQGPRPTAGALLD